MIRDNKLPPARADITTRLLSGTLLSVLVLGGFGTQAASIPTPAENHPPTGGSPPATRSHHRRIVQPLTLPSPASATPAPRQESLLASIEASGNAPKSLIERPSLNESRQDSRATPSLAAAKGASGSSNTPGEAVLRVTRVVASGDTLAGIFKRLGLSAKTLQQVLRQDKSSARRLARLRPGQTLVLERAKADGALRRIMLRQKTETVVNLRLPMNTGVRDVGIQKQPSTKVRHIHHRVKRGETLAGIFKRNGLTARTLQEVLKADRSKARQLARIQPGQQLQLSVTADGRLLSLELARRSGKLIVVTLAAPAEAKSSPTLAEPPRHGTPSADRSASDALPSPQRIVEALASAAPRKVADEAPEEHPTADKTKTDPATTTASETTPQLAEQSPPPGSRASQEDTGVETIAHVVRKGETLASIFKQYGLRLPTVHKVLHAGKSASTLSRIRPGQEIELAVTRDGDTALQRLRFHRSPIETLVVERKGNDYRAHLDKKPVERRIANVEGTIRSSLFADGQKAGLSDGQIMELAEIFGWDIDFALELQPGDQFRVVYEEQLVDGKKYRNGPILAAEFVNRGKTYQAFRFEHGKEVGYYDAKGRSKRRAFIRTPIRFARISSRFQPKRWHPIQHKWKSHKGVDYAAPRGTPIKATGDGRVIFRGWKRGYGRVVIIQHSSRYRTLYAHMSRFRSKVKQGSRVRQGEVIGYVGQSGWATGPHLHYEFRVNNVQRNPLTVKLPRSLPLPRKQLALFKRKTAPLVRRLALIRARSMVARSTD